MPRLFVRKFNMMFTAVRYTRYEVQLRRSKWYRRVDERLQEVVRYSKL